MNDTVLTIDDGGVCVITLNRPERLNAINAVLLDGLNTALARAALPARATCAEARARRAAPSRNRGGARAGSGSGGGDHAGPGHLRADRARVGTRAFAHLRVAAGRRRFRLMRGRTTTRCRATGGTATTCRAPRRNASARWRFGTSTRTRGRGRGIGWRTAGADRNEESGRSIHDRSTGTSPFTRRWQWAGRGSPSSAAAPRDARSSILH